MRLGLATLILLSCDAAAAELESTATELLQRRCLSCHNAKVQMAKLDLSSREAALRGGLQGAALLPGSAGNSLLWKRITEGQMPPSAPLPASERDAIQAWINAGAPWSANLIEKRAGLDWWSLQPLRAQTPKGIDHWVTTKLRDAGLSLSPNADRRTLIRRLSFDLLGLPPDPTEVEAFVTDPAPDAYARLVDRYLASPHYGERWARHWLDVARYAESEGFERDEMREHVWRYRDYVIRSLNADKPFPQFAREQIAGDVLPSVTHDSLVASAFLTMGPTDAVGLTSAVQSERDSVREDTLEEMLGVVSQSFLGLTVNCARCHDHKFDPIPQRDYYRMRSVFSAVWPSLDNNENMIDVNPGSLPLLTPQEHKAREARLQPIHHRIAAITAEIATLYRSVRPAAPSAAIARWTFDIDAHDEIGTLHGTLTPKARLDGGGLQLGDGKDNVVTATGTIPKDIREKTLEAWIRLRKAPEKSVTLFEIRNQSGYRGSSLDGIQLTGGKQPKWQNNSIGNFRTEDAGGAPETAQAGERVQVAIVYTADDRIRIYRNGQPYGKAYLPEPGTPAAKLQTFFAADAIVRFSVSPDVVLEEARLYDRPLQPAELAASFETGIANFTAADLEARLSPPALAQLHAHQAELAALQKQLAAEPTPPPAWIPSIRPAEPTRLLVRGDVTRKADIVTPGGMSALRTLPADLGLPADATDAAKRRAFADWVTHPDNPLFWRVAVNRVWHYHFGAGLVENPNDFGYNGGQPSHPELLDELAVAFRATGGSLKSLHRLILLSDTYRQSAKHRPEAAAKDAGNRLLWRYSPTRVQGEVARDTMLAVSGSLHREMYGPSFRPFTIGSGGGGSYKEYKATLSEEPAQQRRTIYRMNVVTAGDALLESMDCPLPAVKMPKRSATTTALQALSLMNNGFVQQQTKRFAARLTKDTPDPAAQVRRAFLLAYQREPAAWELQQAQDLAAQHGLETLCWGILNTSEFLYVE